MPSFPLVLIGCGDFGAAAVDHLQTRGRELQDVGAFKVAGKAVSRKLGADLFQQQVPKLTADLRRVHADAIFGVVASAEDAASGGMLVAAMEWLKRDYSRHRRVVWLALPPGKAGSLQRARAYATLLEVEQLRHQGAMERCFLYELRKDGVAQAPLFGDAAVAYARQGARPAGVYAGFGLGVLLDPKVALDQLTPPIAGAVAAQHLQGQGTAPAQALSGLRDRLVQSLKPLLVPVTETAPYRAHQWLPKNHIVRQTISSESAEPQTVVQHFTNSLQNQVNYYRNLVFTREAKVQWDDARNRTMADLRSVVDGFRAGGNAALGQELLAGLDQLSSEVARAVQSSQKEQERYEKTLIELQAEIDMVRMARGWTDNPRLRPELLRILQERDHCFAGKTVEAYREVALVAVAQQLGGGEIRTTLESSGNRAERAATLLDALRQVAPESAPALASHILAPSVTQQQAEELLASRDRTFRYPIVAQIDHAIGQRDPAAWVRNILDATLRQLKVADFPIHLSREDQRRKDWMQGTAPSLSLADGSAAPWVWKLSPKLPADYKLDFQKRGASQVHDLPFVWFANECLVYAETGEVTLDMLASMPDLAEAYKFQLTQPATRNGLHVLPDPDGGWQIGQPLQAARAPGPSAQAKERMKAAAQTLVRSSLLGLVTPVGEGGACVARYLSPDGKLVVARPLGTVDEALQRIAEDDELRGRLEELSGRWRDDLLPRQLAAFFGLILWFQARALKKEQGIASEATVAQLTETLQQEGQAVRKKLEELGGPWIRMATAMTRCVGSELDDYSLAAGRWRYVKW